eukprot:1286448-Amphidinium_carterae.1
MGLLITLTRTKTSGESRPTHVLEAYVAEQASVSDTTWLYHGWQEHFAHANPEDFMVQVPAKGDALVTEHQLNFR